MSSGAVHTKASIILFVALGATALFSRRPELYESAIGSLFGVLISPDLDLSNGGMVNGKMIEKKVGWIGARIWKFVWGSYSESCKHGSFISHFPIFSTAVRLMYVFFVVILPPILVAKLMFFSYLDLMQEVAWWVKIVFSPYIFIGLAGSDLIHYVLDIATKEKK